MNIEEAIENCIKYIELVMKKDYCDCNELNVISNGKHCYGSKNVAEAIETIISEYTRQKEINEEHQKENGELQNNLTTIYLKGVYDEKGKWKDKIKAIVGKLEKEETICQEKFDNLWRKDNLSDYEKIKKGFLVDMQQEIGAIKGMLEELLEGE